jgi:glycosyltransferase involved in cell wall biosynthesis
VRIVQISTVEQGGGAEKTARALHRAYLERGHDSVLIVAGKDSDDPTVLEIDNSARERGVRRIAARVADRVGLEDRVLPGSRRIPALAGRTDVIHAHNLHGRYFDLAVLPRLARRAPTILTLQDMWLLTGHCAHSFDNDRWETGCGACPYLGTYPALRRDATRWNHRRKRRLTGRVRLNVSAPSTWLLDRVARSHLARHPRRLVPNSCDLGVFAPGDAAAARRELGLPTDRPILFFPANVGLHNQFKDPATLLRALRHLHDLRPLLLAFGAKDGASVEGLTRLAPTRSESLMASYYRAADIVVYPSRADTAPIALIEALACARPAVATPVGGIPEIVADGESGLLAPADDRLFAAAIRRLLDDRELRGRLGETGRRVAEQRYDFRRAVDTWLDWYAELAA